MSDQYTPIKWLRSDDPAERAQAERDWQPMPFADDETATCSKGHAPTRKVWYVKTNLPAEFPNTAACIGEVCPVCKTWGRWVSTDPQKGGRFLPASQAHFS